MSDDTPDIDDVVENATVEEKRQAMVPCVRALQQELHGVGADDE